MALFYCACAFSKCKTVSRSVSYLDSVVSGATTIEQGAEIENLAQQKSLEAVLQHALEKTSDPGFRIP